MNLTLEILLGFEKGEGAIAQHGDQLLLQEFLSLRFRILFLKHNNNNNRWILPECLLDIHTVDSY